MRLISMPGSVARIRVHSATLQLLHVAYLIIHHIQTTFSPTPFPFTTACFRGCRFQLCQSLLTLTLREKPTTARTAALPSVPSSPRTL